MEYPFTYDAPAEQFRARQEYRSTLSLCQSKLGREASIEDPDISKLCHTFSIWFTIGVIIFILGIIGFIASLFWYKSNLQKNSTSGFTAGLIALLVISSIMLIVGIFLLIIYW